MRIGSVAVGLTVATGLLLGCSGSGGADGRRAAEPPKRAATVPDADLTLSVGDRVVATVDRRFQSYNIEMVEVTGGEFWRPYDAGPGKVVRDPIDLASARLRNLASALGPAYIRVSGTWANGTYFDADGTTGGVAPEGFDGVLTAEQWKGVGSFAKAVDGRIVTSFASGAAVRDAEGAWLGDQARALLRFSRANDIPLVGVELFNEPNLGIGLPRGYDAAAFARDLSTLETLVEEVMPDLRLVGPGAAGDVTPLVFEPPFSAADILEATGPSFDAFSYHFYPKVSKRCGSTEGPEVGLAPEYLSRIDASRKHYGALRDRHEPEAPMWITETAEAACGGDPWAAQYIDVIRYVDTLGRLADSDGAAVFHNTLAASDYGLLDEDGFVPRPDYWAAVLWSRLMGPRVLAVERAGTPSDLAVYAHCTAGARQGGVTYAVVNSSPDEPRTVATPSGRATVYALTGEALDSGTISLNGSVLEASADGTLPDLRGRAATGAVTVPAASVAFVVDTTGAPACA